MFFIFQKMRRHSDKKIFSTHFGDSMLRSYTFFYQKTIPHLWPKTSSLTTYNTEISRFVY